MTSHEHDGHHHTHDHGDPDHQHGWDLEVTDDATAPSVFAANDVVELTTVGIDVGSSTSHVMFGHVRLERLAQSLSSRFVVTSRETTWRSPILLTPYRPDTTIDAAELERFFDACLREARLRRDDIDTGVVILTGEALKRRNSGAIAASFAGSSGRFVCALAGHHREAVMAALGSGAAPLSRTTGRRILNIDVGGGTTKLALLVDAEVRHTAAFEVGGRLLVRDADERVAAMAEPMLDITNACGVQLRVGDVLSDDAANAIVEAMVNAVVDHVRGTRGPLAETLLVTEPLPDGLDIDAVTFSGGVAEYVYGRDDTDYRDLGGRLGRGLRAACEDGRIPFDLLEPEQGIRATAVGVSQFSVQVSGNTVSAGARTLLPLRNVPVVRPVLDGLEADGADGVAGAISRGVARGDAVVRGPLAVAITWDGDPEHHRLFRLADGLRVGLARTEWASTCPDDPVVVLVDADVARSLGRLFEREVDLHRPVVCLDGIAIEDCDYVDLGEMLEPERVVPVVVKSLLFDAVDVLDEVDTAVPT